MVWSRKKFVFWGALFFSLNTVSAWAQTEVANSKLQLTSSFRFRIEGSEKTDFSTNRSYMPLRIRPEFKYNYNDGLFMVFTPQFSKTFGEPIYTLAPNTGTATSQQSSGGTTDSTIGFHEGYLSYQPTDYFILKTGRQIISYGDELVIGALEWNNVGRTFDAVNAKWMFDTFWIDTFFSKLVDNNTVASGAGDVNLYGLYSSQKWEAASVVVLDGYFFHREDSSANPANYLEAVGLRFSLKSEGFNLRAEATKEFGPFFTDEGSAYQGDAEVSYTFNSDLKPRLGVEYFIAGKTYNQLYPTAHKWLGYADVLGRVNVTGFVIHGKTNLNEKLTLNLDSHYFARASQDAPIYKINGTTALGTANGSGSSFVGTEWDFTTSYQISKPLTISGGVGYFMSGSFLTDQFGALNPIFYYFQLDSKF